MERREEREEAPVVAGDPSWLNLGVHGLYRDARKLVNKTLDAFDRALVKEAHLSNQPVRLDEAFASGCAKRGYLGLLQWAREQGCRWDEDTCAVAALGGHLELLQWVRQNGCPCDESVCWGAARGGHLELLQWARQNGCPWDWTTCAEAARGGYLALL